MSERMIVTCGWEMSIRKESRRKEKFLRCFPTTLI